MSEAHGIISGVFTIVLMVTFLGIWFWAWRPRHRPVFDALAEMPLEDLAGSRVIPQPAAPLARVGRERQGQGRARDGRACHGRVDLLHREQAK